MRFLHTADWHIGKKIYGYDLLNEQKEMVENIITMAKEHQVDAIVIAGDLYDRSVPSSESVALLNSLLFKINMEEKLPILAISGNHDSRTRLNTGTPWFTLNDFFLNTELSKSLEPIEIKNVQFYLLPYFDLFDLQQLFPDVKTLQEGFDQVILEMKKTFHPEKKQVLVGHFFAVGAKKSESEIKVEVGGLQAISTDQLEAFSYVLLGHLHSKDALHHDKIAYSGSPFPYSLPEGAEKKGVYLVDTKENTRQFLPLPLKKNLRQLTDTFENFLQDEKYQPYENDYVGLHLADKKPILNVMIRLKERFPYLLEITREKMTQVTFTKKESLKEDPLKVFTDFYQEVTEENLTKTQEEILAHSLAHILKEED